MLAWARERAAPARYNLGRTGMADRPWDQLGIGPDLVAAIGRDEVTLVRRLRERLATRHGVGAAEVALLMGTTHANFCALAAVLDPDGGEVILETPTYGPLSDAACALGASVVPLVRRERDAFQPDPDDLRRLLSPRTRAVVLTDLHNPSGVAMERPRLGALVEAVARHGRARLIVDEVYLEFLAGTPPPSAYATGAPVIACRSLTKAFGLGWLRAGWALADAATVTRMAEINDYMTALVPSPVAAAALGVLERDEELRLEARQEALRGFGEVRAWAGRHAAVALVAPCAEAPVIAFPRLMAGGADTSGIVERARAAYDTAVAPGALFGAPAHVRIATLRGPDVVREGLLRLDRAMEDGSAGG